MKRLYLVLHIMFVVNSMVIAQTVAERSEQIRTLREQIQRSKDDSNKADLLYNLVGRLSSADSFEALLATTIKEHDLAVKLNYNYGTVVSSWGYCCYYYRYKKDYVTASKYLLTANEIIEQHNMDTDPRIEIFMYFGILNHFFMIGDFTNVMKIVSKKLALYERLNDKGMITHYNSLMGFIFLRQGKTGDSKKYYQKYLQQARELNDSVFMADAYNCMADVYVLEQNYDSALLYSFSAIGIYRKVTAIFPLRMPKGMYKWERIAYTSYKIGNIYKLTHQYPEALRYTLDAVNYTKSNSGFDQFDQAAYYINAGDIYKELKNYNKALKYLDTGLAISKEIAHAENIRDAYCYMGQTFLAQKKYDSAYTYNLLYTKLKDSITNEKSNGEIEQIHTSYEVDKKDNEILLLNQQNKLREATIAKQNLSRNIIIVAGILIALLIVLLYSRRQLQQKNKFQTELNRQRNELFNTVLTTQEKERKRIAQDLHDGLGSVLSAAKLKLSELEDSFSIAGGQKEKYAVTLTLLDEAATELRNVAHNIMPATLAKIGLVAALQSIFDSISTYSGLHIRFSAYDMDKRLGEETEVSIYRIILELVNNVVKHAKATEVTVQLIKHPSYINITVEDNGIGFNYAQVTHNASGIGLNNIASRVDYLKGTIDFDSGKGKVTTVFINIPFQ